MYFCLKFKKTKNMEETFNKPIMPENREIRAAALGELRGKWQQPVLCT